MNNSKQKKKENTNWENTETAVLSFTNYEFLLLIA
jgi:hypothetical protein